MVATKQTFDSCMYVVVYSCNLATLSLAAPYRTIQVCSIKAVCLRGVNPVAYMGALKNRDLHCRTLIDNSSGLKRFPG